jgi:HPt (histidine-containing phosphotransfer) domain-containing protein
MSQAAGAPEPLDLPVLRQLFTALGERAPLVFAKLVNSYLSNCEELLAQGRAALAEGQWETLAQVSHTLKGNSAAFGALQVSLAARTLEQAVMNRQLDALEALVDRLASELARAHPALVQVRDTLLSG